jgi:hypothetical protein
MDTIDSNGTRMNFTFKSREGPIGRRESVHSGDIFLGERVARVRDEQASLTDGSVTNDDKFHALMPFASKERTRGSERVEKAGQRVGPTQRH